MVIMLVVAGTYCAQTIVTFARILGNTRNLTGNSGIINDSPEGKDEDKVN